jgi:hypothetical protein
MLNEISEQKYKHCCGTEFYVDFFSKTSRSGKPSMLYGPGTGRILLDNLKCNGNESTIQNCEHDGWGITNCTNGDDIGVDCEDDSIGKNILKCLESFSFLYIFYVTKLYLI